MKKVAECTNRQFGELLHAFELDALPPEEEELFAVHLLQCQYCCDELESFRESAACLRDSVALKELATHVAATYGPANQASEARKSRRFGVPSLRAVLSLSLIVVAAAISIYHWSPSPTRPRLAVQTVTLGGVRGSGSEIKLSESDSAEVRVVLDGIRQGAAYQLRIECAADGREILRQTAIDSVGSNYLTIGFGLSNFREEHYRICIFDSLGPIRDTVHFSVKR